MVTGSVLCTSMQCSITFCSLSEEAGDVIVEKVIEGVGLDIRVNFGDSRSNRSRDIRRAHFVSDEPTIQEWETKRNPRLS